MSVGAFRTVLGAYYRWKGRSGARRCAEMTESLRTYAHIPGSARNPRQSFPVGTSCKSTQGQAHPRPARRCSALTTHWVEVVGAHTAPDTHRRRAARLRTPSPCPPPTRSQQGNPGGSPSPCPPLPRRPPRRRHEQGGRAALSSRGGRAPAQPPGAALQQNINFPESGRHYATAAGGAPPGRVYVPAPGRCDQSGPPLPPRQQKFM